MGERESTYIPERFADLLDGDRPREALRLLLAGLQDRPWDSLEPSDLRMLDQLCQQALPQLLQYHVRWLLGDADQLGQLADLLERMLAAQYRSPSTLEQLAWVRCLMGMSAAMHKDLDAAHRQICRAQSHADEVPRPNGEFQAAASRLELMEGAAGGFLRGLFGVYFQCLRKMGHHEMANSLESQVQTLIDRIETDEMRPGVVRALFYNKESREGHTRLIHASILSDLSDLSDAPDAPGATEDKQITYARAGIDQLDSSAHQAAHMAVLAADEFLRHGGYPDGLEGRRILWEISTLAGEPVDVPRTYGGGSLGLPLTVAVISAYLGQAVPNDTSLTGALARTSWDATEIQAVDGVAEKLGRALSAGCRRVFIPAGNIADFTASPALQHAAQSAGAQVRPVSRLHEACQELFPPEGKGTIKAMAADALREVWRMFRPNSQEHSRVASPDSHRLHVLLSTAFLACIFLLEGLKNFLALGGDYPRWLGIVRIAASTSVVVAGLLFSYGLILASLRHRKNWAWLASIAITGAAMATTVPILSPMLPKIADISVSRQWPVLVSLVKDAFIFWLFAWILLTNTYSVTVGLEHLIRRHQHVTARRCLGWDSFLEGRMPVRAVHFPWNYGALAFFLIGIFLLVWEMLYYWNLRSDLPAVYWETSLGLVRDMMLIAAAAEAMIFYKVALAAIRKALA